MMEGKKEGRGGRGDQRERASQREKKRKGLCAAFEKLRRQLSSFKLDSVADIAKRRWKFRKRGNGEANHRNCFH